MVRVFVTGACTSSYKTHRYNMLQPFSISVPLSQPPPLWQHMTKDYQRFWKDVTSANDEGETVRTLAGIVLDREGTGWSL